MKSTSQDRYSLEKNLFNTTDTPKLTTAPTAAITTVKTRSSRVILKKAEHNVPPKNPALLCGSLIIRSLVIYIRYNRLAHRGGYRAGNGQVPGNRQYNSR